MRDDSKYSLFLQWARLNVGMVIFWVPRYRWFGKYQMVGINVDVCCVCCVSDQGDIRGPTTLLARMLGKKSGST